MRGSGTPKACQQSMAGSTTCHFLGPPWLQRVDPLQLRCQALAAWLGSCQL